MPYSNFLGGYVTWSVKRFWSITRYFSQGNSTRTSTWQIDSALTKVSHITFCSVDFFVHIEVVLYMMFSDLRPSSFNIYQMIYFLTLFISINWGRYKIFTWEFKIDSSNFVRAQTDFMLFINIKCLRLWSIYYVLTGNETWLPCFNFKMTIIVQTYFSAFNLFACHFIIYLQHVV